ncbi:flagellar protein FliT [Dechloromonas sp. ZS-1]|uniref:flagellar protein FliT n=1 Tax=Dechloromonas sp. ZS-1 TaxID=3138067 RepID=UPI0031FC3624
MIAGTKPSLLRFYEALAEFNKRILAAREESDWDLIEQLASTRQNWISQHDAGKYLPPTPPERQKILQICQQIQASESELLDEAQTWQGQIQRFIMN